ncbi:hypothetical protein ABD76_02390 [Paenibacillus dendritiformis]|nr:hypothetical protein [Paenibacillus dendritiformis]
MPFRGSPSARGDMPVRKQGVRVLHHQMNGGRAFADRMEKVIADRNKMALLSVISGCKRTTP